MPTRDIKESCRSSFTLAQISPEAERFFWRLITYADDFGRFPADAALLRAQCFSAMVDRIPEAAVAAWRGELARADLIRLYEAEGKPWGYFPTWVKHQRTRARHSKYPPPVVLPAAAVICQHVPACVGTCRQMPADVAVVTEEPENTEKTVVRLPASASTRRHVPADAGIRRQMPAQQGVPSWHNGQPPDTDPKQVKAMLAETKKMLDGGPPEDEVPF